MFTEKCYLMGSEVRELTSRKTGEKFNIYRLSFFVNGQPLVADADLEILDGLNGSKDKVVAGDNISPTEVTATFELRQRGFQYDVRLGAIKQGK